MSHIFISYARKDIDFAEKIVKALAERHLDTWIDWMSIPKGEYWEQEIYQGIEEADALLFLISPDSVRSQMCNKEIAHAVENSKRILPIVIRDSDVANFLNETSRQEISKRNWIFCRDRQDDFFRALEQVFSTIHTDYKWVRFHTDLLVKAKRWEQKKDSSRLLRDRELREAEQQLAEISSQEDPQPTRLQREYILLSRRREERQRRQTTSSLAIGLIIIAGLALVAWGERNSAIASEETAIAEANARATAQAIAETNETLAEERAKIALARQLAAQAQSINPTRNSKQTIADLLAVQSMRILPSSEAAQFLLNKDFASHITVRIIQDDTVTSIAFSPDGKYVASGSRDGSVRLSEITMGKVLFHMAHDSWVTSVAFSSDGKYMVSGSGDHTARIWETASGKEITRITHNDTVESVAFSPDGKYVVSGGDSTARVWETSTGKEIARMTHSLFRDSIFLVYTVQSVAFSPDGKYVASGSDGHDARVWEAFTGEEVASMTYNTLSRVVVTVAFSPDGKYVVSSGCDKDGHSLNCAQGSARVWEASTGKEVARMMHAGPVNALAFSPDGRYVVSGSQDATVRVWEAYTGKEVTRMAHAGPVYALAFSPDGKYVVSGGCEKDDVSYCAQGSARVWEASTGQEVARVTHAGPVNALAFSPDGRYVVSGSQDATVRVWVWQTDDVIAKACSYLSRNLTRTEWKQYIGDVLPYQAVCPNLPIEPEPISAP